MKFDLSPADFLIWLLASFFIKTASRPSFSFQSRSGTYGPQRPARALSNVTIASRELLRALFPGPISPTVLQVLSNGPGLIGPFTRLFRSGSLVLFWLYYIPNSFVGVLFPGVCWVLFSELPSQAPPNMLFCHTAGDGGGSVLYLGWAVSSIS